MSDWHWLVTAILMSAQPATCVFGQSVRTDAATSTLFVDDQALPNGNGHSWSTAFRFLQDALAAARQPGAGVAEIHIAQGRYAPDRSEASPLGTKDKLSVFRLVNCTAIIGGYAGIGAPNPDARDPQAWPTRLSADFNNDDQLLFGSTVENGYRVLLDDVVAGEFLIDGVELSGASAVGQSSYSGAALRLTGGRVTMQHCRIALNRAEGCGGIWLQGNSSGMFEDCQFVQNYGKTFAGAIRVDPGSRATVRQCLFDRNDAESGGGIYNAEAEVAVFDTTFFRNTARRHGAAIYAVNASTGMRGCTFQQNHAVGDNYGGGAAIFSSGTLGARSVTAVQCQFLDNISSRGGAMSIDYAADVVVDQCNFSGNKSLSYAGAAIWIQVTVAGGKFRCLDSTFSDNSTVANSAVEAHGLMEIRHCLFQQNTGRRAAALLISDSGASLVSGCTFLKNSISDGFGPPGSALEVTGCQGLQIWGCSFLGNSLSMTGGGGGGGAMFVTNSSVQIGNTLYSGNLYTSTSGSGTGGGAILVSSGTLALNNCTLSRNGTNRLGGGVHVASAATLNAVNCVFWENSDLSGMTESSQIYRNGPNANVNYCAVQGLTGALGGSGNLGGNPQFVNPGGPDGTNGTADDNCRLAGASPCIDAADGGALVLCRLDRDGRVRAFNVPTIPDTGVGFPTPDMGAYEFASPVSLDCNSDTMADSCQGDCNLNGQPDDCDLALGDSQDCNLNGLPDECDQTGGALDCNGNGVLDICEVADAAADCNRNGRPDDCDIAGGFSHDCNGNSVPDECDIACGASRDCNHNGFPDECDLAGPGGLDCNGNGILDSCDVTSGLDHDCNANGQLDSCDLAQGTSVDLNGNGAPDECDADCNNNDIPDFVEIAGGATPDCNHNQIPDSCDMAAGTSADCNGNGIPDSCDIVNGAADADGNGVPDSCQPDCNHNGMPDSRDIAAGTSIDCNHNGLPDECEVTSGLVQDCNHNGVPDGCDVLAPVLAQSGPLSPVGAGIPLQLLLKDVRPAASNVTIQISASADLASIFEFMDVQLNSTPIATVFQSDGHNCPANPDMVTVTLTSAAYNAALNGRDATITLIPSDHVNAEHCPSSFASVTVTYTGRTAADLDGNGLPDDCQCEADVSPQPLGNGVVDIDDLVLVITQWGAAGGAGDVAPIPLGDGMVNIDDLVAVIVAWGACP